MRTHLGSSKRPVRRTGGLWSCFIDTGTTSAAVADLTSSEGVIDMTSESSGQSRISRRNLLGSAALAGGGLAVGSALGGVSPAFAAATKAAGSPYPSHPTWTFTLVNHVTTSEFFVPTRY